MSSGEPLHAIAHEVGAKVEQRADGLFLSRRNAAAMKEALAKVPAKDLPAAVLSLISLAAHMEKNLGSTKTADVILGIARSASGAIANAEGVLMAAPQDSARAAVDKLDFLCGTRRVRTARRFGAPPPSGTVPASALLDRRIIR